MKRIKHMGVAAIAAFVLTAALGATSASASWIASESSAIKATPTGSHVFGVSNTYYCTASSFESKGPIATQALESGMIGDFTCSAWGQQKLKWNGCKLTMRPGAETSFSVFSGTVDIGPAGCGPLKMIYLGACEQLIYPKTGLAATFTNSGKGSEASVTLDIKGSGLKYESNCDADGTEGSYTGSWKLTASQGVKVSRLGVYLSGEESAEESTQPKFNSETYTVGVGGTASSPLAIEFPSVGTAQCYSGAFSSALIKAMPTLLLRGGYSSCSAVGLSATSKLNSCGFLLRVANAPAYQGTAAIECEKAGDTIQISPIFFGVAVCTFSFPAQEIGSVSYQNLGSGVNRTVNAKVSGKGIKYTVQYAEGVKGTCGPESGEATLSAGYGVGTGYLLP